MKMYGGVTGVINLSAKDGALYKQTLICHTGLFDAMFGPVEITKEKLERVAERYNKQHASVQNDADYAPVLVDHARAADLIKGRIMADLSIDKWTDPEDGTEGWGLFGTLRIDDKDAQNKVEGTNGESKKYAHVSMSFDDDATYELFEVSFVAVEAARRAIVLSNGGRNMDLQAKLTALETKQKSLMKRIKLAREARGTELAGATECIVGMETHALALGAKIIELVADMKEKALGAQFRSFVKEGRLTKAELDKLNFKELSAMDQKAIKALLGSYAARAVSSDVIQHGQTGAKPVSTANLSAEQMREMMKNQKTGKPATLAEGDDKSGKGDDDKNKNSDSILGYDDMEDSLKHCQGLSEIVEKLHGSLKKMSEQMKKMSEADKGEEKEDSDAA